MVDHDAPPSSDDRPPNHGPLRGRRVAVTRSAAEVGALARRLAALGAEVVEVPLIAAAPPADGGQALAAAAAEAAAGTVDWVVLSSPTGARRLLAALDGRVPVARIAAVGPGTAAVLTGAGVVVDLVPPRHLGEGLVEVFPDAPAPGDGGGGPPSAEHGGGVGGRVLVVRAAVARDVVPDGLAARGWDVGVVEAYRTVVVAPDAADVAALAAADVVTLTSSSTADALADLVDATGGLTSPPAVCIGPVTAATAESRGLRCVAVAEPHDLDGLVAVVVDVVGDGTGGKLRRGTP